MGVVKVQRSEVSGMKEITRYQASWGAWYVQVLLDDGRRMELKFKEEPKPEEVEKVALAIPPAEELTPADLEPIKVVK
jgi:hypothetical protein